MVESVPFCERNIKGWIGLLGAVAAGVLVVAVVMASSGHRGFGLERARRMWGGSGGKLQAGPASGSGVRPPAQPRGATPLALPPAAGATFATGQPLPPGGNVDVVAGATPGGGIKFIGGPGAPHPSAVASFRLAAAQVRPAVVSISAIRPAQVPPPSPTPGGATFQNAFDGIPDRIVYATPWEAVGSGVIVDPAGYVVTNHHVISGATSLLVSLWGRGERHLSAQVLLSDPASDLALLKLPGGNFPYATLGDSSRLRPGDWVIAVGYPFGLELTVTAGIVSGTHADLVIAGRPYRALLQIDAPINKGSSGGPLVDQSGQVMGINTAIYAPTGVFSGTGFSIPSNRVGAFVARALTSASATTPWQPIAQQPAPGPGPAQPSAAWMGVGLVDVTPEMATQLSYPREGGVFVASVILDSPADEAEIARGDVIVSLAGQKATDVEAVGRLVASMVPGQAIPVVVWRVGALTTTTLRLRGGG